MGELIISAIMAILGIIGTVVLGPYFKSKLDKDANSPKSMGVGLSGSDLQGVRNWKALLSELVDTADKYGWGAEKYEIIHAERNVVRYVAWQNQVSSLTHVHYKVQEKLKTLDTGWLLNDHVQKLPNPRNSRGNQAKFVIILMLLLVILLASLSFPLVLFLWGSHRGETVNFWGPLIISVIISCATLLAMPFHVVIDRLTKDASRVVVAQFVAIHLKASMGQNVKNIEFTKFDRMNYIGAGFYNKKIRATLQFSDLRRFGIIYWLWAVWVLFLATVGRKLYDLEKWTDEAMRHAPEVLVSDQATNLASDGDADSIASAE